MMLALYVQAKAMLLDLRREKSAETIQHFLSWQSWQTAARLQMARVRQIADGAGAAPSRGELSQLLSLVSHWEAGRR